MKRFFSLDVETAHPSLASICQIGIVGFVNAEEYCSRNFLIDPDDWFDPINVSIHGIDEQAVIGAPRFPEVYTEICNLIRNEYVVSHTHFDRGAMKQTADRFGLPSLECEWLDTAKVARRAWPQFSYSGYGLKNLASHCGITFSHHDAVEDARAAGLVLLRAIEHSGVEMVQWMDTCKRRITPRESVVRKGDGDGALAGDHIVFTGALSIPRRIAADKAAEAGADVETIVTKKTSILVVGDQDIRKFAGKDKSSKQLKVEQLIVEGRSIRIIGESDFLALSSIIS
ncbi:MAG: exonuclease domain-containing protein [Fimbriimonadaceae bacterium]